MIYQEATPDAGEDAPLEDVAAETIIIEHGDDGTTVVLDDATWPEVVGLIALAFALVAGVYLWRRGRKS